MHAGSRWHNYPLLAARKNRPRLSRWGFARNIVRRVGKRQGLPPWRFPRHNRALVRVLV